jgi:uncharacterized protein (DUF427 family)
MADLEPECVQDYPRPPVVQPVPQRISVKLGGQSLIVTHNALRVIETHHAPTYYLPIAELEGDLVPASGRSYCEYKGVAQYWTVTLGDVTVQRAGWSYDAPTKPFRALRGHIALYAGLMQTCYVGRRRVTPQPGDFYGGWVTSNLTGQIKGPPGTEFW